MNRCVSVIIPFFNRSHTIKRAINSLLLKGNEEFIKEIIIVNDGSNFTETNKLISIVNSFKSKSEIKFKQIDYSVNVNAAHARNVGLENSISEVVAFLDSDDEWRENKLKKQLTLLDDNTLVFCQFKKYTGKGISFQNSIKPKNYYNTNISEYLLLEDGHVSTCTMVLKKHIAESVKFNPDLNKYQDWDFAIRAYTNGIVFKFLKEPLVNVYCDGNDRITLNSNQYLVNDLILSIGPHVDKKTIYKFILLSSVKLCVAQKKYLSSFFKVLNVNFIKEFSISYIYLILKFIILSIVINLKKALLKHVNS